MVPLLLSLCHNLRLQDGKFCRKCLALRMMNTATKKEDPTCFQLYDSEFDEDSMKNIPRFAREVFRYSILLYWKKCSTIIYNICTSNVQSPAHCQDHCWRYHHPHRVRNPARRECLCKAPSNSRLQMPVFWLPAVHVSCNSCKFVAGKLPIIYVSVSDCFSNYCKGTRMKQLQLFLQFASFRSKVRHRSSF